MPVTPFEPKLKEISDTIHLTYRDILYPSLFGVKPDAITYDDLPEEFRKQADGHLSVDCFMDVKFKGLRNAMRWTVSYRFRQAEHYQHYQDVTFTEYNHASDLISEVSKLCVNYFTYGYFNSSGHLVEAVIINVPRLKTLIASGKIQPAHEDVPNFRSMQSFVSYSFEELKRCKCIHRHFKEVDGQLVESWE